MTNIKKISLDLPTMKPEQASFLLDLIDVIIQAIWDSHEKDLVDLIIRDLRSNESTHHGYDSFNRGDDHVIIASVEI